MSKVKFYICRHCGNLVEMIHDAGVPVICCGEKMEELKANTVDASAEKHVPAVTVEGELVKVQVYLSVTHPMSSPEVFRRNVPASASPLALV